MSSDPPPSDSTGGDVERLRAENEVLRSRLRDMGSAPGADSAPPGAAGPASWPTPIDTPRLRQGLWLLAVVALAALPPALVVQDRWLGDDRGARLFAGLWCRGTWLCDPALPAYIVAVIACIAGVVALVWRRGVDRPVFAAPQHWPVATRPTAVSAGQARRARWLWAVASLALLGAILNVGVQHGQPGLSMAVALAAYLAGWVVRTVPAADVLGAWRRRPPWWTAAVMAVLTLIVLLKARYSDAGLTGLALLLAVVTWGRLLRHARQLPVIFWAVTLALVLYSAGTNAWWYAVVGDEWEFFLAARGILEQSPLATATRLFDAAGVFGTHPYLSSVIQASFMALLGPDNFGWRFGGQLLCALALYFFHGFFRTFASARFAGLMAFWLAGAYYLMTFSKIGYNNLQALFAMSLVLAAAAWAVRSATPLAFVATGAAVAFCGYVYPAALYVTPLPFLLLLLYLPPTSARPLRLWALLLATIALMGLPLAVQGVYWQTKVPGTLFVNPALVASWGSALGHIGHNVAYSLLSFVYSPEEGHFLASSFVDPVSGGLAILGAAVCLARWRRERFCRFVWVGFGLLVFLVGASHDRAFPPSTRMFLLLPWFGLFAVAGLLWLVGELQRLWGSRVPERAILLGTVLVVLGVNLYQQYGVAQGHWADFPGFEAHFLRLAQHSRAVAPDADLTYTVVTDPDWGITGLRTMARAYTRDFRGVRLEQVTVESPHLPDDRRGALADPSTVVILKPWFDAAWTASLSGELRALGKQPCVVRSANGGERFTLWHAQDLAWLCP